MIYPSVLRSTKVWEGTSTSMNPHAFHGPIASSVLQFGLQDINLWSESIELFRKFSKSFSVQRYTPFSQVHFQVFSAALKSWWVISWYNPYLAGMLYVQANQPMTVVTMDFGGCMPCNLRQITSFQKLRVVCVNSYLLVLYLSKSVLCWPWPTLAGYWKTCPFCLHNTSFCFLSF